MLSGIVVYQYQRKDFWSLSSLAGTTLLPAPALACAATDAATKCNGPLLSSVGNHCQDCRARRPQLGGGSSQGTDPRRTFHSSKRSTEQRALLPQPGTRNDIPEHSYFRLASSAVATVAPPEVPQKMPSILTENVKTADARHGTSHDSPSLPKRVRSS